MRYYYQDGGLNSMIEMREELLHSAFSHFPIALLTLALLTKTLFYIFVTKQPKIASNLSLISKFLMFSAPIFFLISIFLGDLAVDIIKNDICNLTLVYEHEHTAQLSLIYFLIAISCEIILGLEALHQKSLRFALHTILMITLIIGNFYMLKSAHLGGDMVYNHGVAVKNYPCPK